MKRLKPKEGDLRSYLAVGLIASQAKANPVEACGPSVPSFLRSLFFNFATERAASSFAGPSTADADKGWTERADSRVGQTRAKQEATGYASCAKSGISGVRVD